MAKYKMTSPFEITPLSPECFWGKFDPPTIQFCERNLCEIITQPANTWSNLAFIFVGVYLLRKDAKSRTAGWISILIGATSFLYHASFTFLMQFFDLSSMYLYSAFLLTMNLKRTGLLKDQRQMVAMSSIVLFSMITLFFFRKAGIPVFSVQVILAIILEIYINRKSDSGIIYKNYFIALLLFLMAFGIWILDLTGIFCSPDNHFLQGHAIWHILCALSIIYLNKFYSDK
ncbi:MAG: ceramidase [Leptospira sp.]|nr:ceramidase [Leptospira sp.]